MFCSLFDPVDSVTEFDNIHVQLHYPLLCQQMLHQEREVGFQPLPDPGSSLPEKQRARALVGDGRDTSHWLVLTLSPLDRLLHLDPVKAIVTEKSAIFHLPDSIQKVLGNLVERNQSIVNVTPISLRSHCLNTPKDHECGNRRIEKADVENLQDGDESDENDEQDTRPQPAWTISLFPGHDRTLIRNESKPIF